MATSPQTAIDTLRAEQVSLIGGSSIHHVFNLEPYGCQLQLIRRLRGQEPDHPFHGNNATERGSRLEDMAADLFAEQTGFNVRRVAGGLLGKAKRDQNLSWRGVHSDREIVGVETDILDPNGKVVNAKRGPGLLSIKVPGEMMFRKIKQEGLPHAYYLQLQYELGIWNREWGTFLFFWADGWQTRHFNVARDESIISEVYVGVDRTWEMAQTETLDLQKLKLKPEDRRCASCQFRTKCQGEDMLAEAAGAEQDGDIQFDGHPELIQLVVERQERKDLKEQADALLTETEDKIRATLDKRTAIDTQGARIYFRWQDGRETFQKKPFEKAHPELAPEIKKFTNVGKPFRTLRIYPR